MLIVRLARVAPVRRRLLVEAVVELGAARLATAVLPFSKLVRWSCSPGRRELRGDLGDVLWAVRSAAPRMPFRALCLQQSLALQRMLRRRGQDARLHYGLTNAGPLEAHAWVSLDGTILIGGAEAERFREVAAWP